MGKIVCFGDSITQGYMVDPRDSYPTRLSIHLGEEVINLGVSGDTSFDGRARISQVLSIRPDLTVVEFGINDFLSETPVELCMDNLSAICTHLVDGGSRLALAGFKIPGFEPGPWPGMYQELARRHGAILIEDIFDGISGRQECFLSDGLHPNQEGYRVIASKVAQALGTVVDAGD